MAQVSYKQTQAGGKLIGGPIVRTLISNMQPVVDWGFNYSDWYHGRATARANAPPAIAACCNMFVASWRVMMLQHVVATWHGMMMLQIFCRSIAYDDFCNRYYHGAPQLAHYSAHDSTLMAIAATLGLDDPAVSGAAHALFLKIPGISH